MDLAALIARDRPRFRTATAFVEAVLREAILSGRLPGGAALRQEELAAAFEVSRMPVREALRQLEAQALVDFAPHKGAVVTDISAADAADNYAIRAALEPAALRLSIPHLTADDLARAEALLAEMDGEDDIARLGDLNRRFHLTLSARAGRHRLLALVEQHLAAADRYLRFHFTALGRDHMARDEHAALLAAARDRDPDTAARIAATHVETAARNIEAFFARR
ncbi:GntR family transcriptional regulator [Zavarzinia compransoris]|uniref:GntR family transcriptional regulator n=1 Tax=Zavarzinia compransoris TaxID=1264899 RepID=A0A317E600_9PROT|nr:GntR family transcriptional regulator [Zavarzinia compransoris]PWR21764.1 GntR family transcriptional regulator [Zavarzinia compransoris]TDP45438.1 GntR family transcriptional regulator [Zavarzinia compransoris]